jgi:hypothetical protein
MLVAGRRDRPTPRSRPDLLWRCNVDGAVAMIANSIWYRLEHLNNSHGIYMMNYSPYIERCRQWLSVKES